MSKTTIAGVSAVQILPKETHKYTLIFLHGLGDTGEGWTEIASFVRKKHPQVFDNAKFIFPNAELRPITVNGGMVMSGWADVVSFDGATEDTKGYIESSCKIQKLVENEINSGVTSHNIILGGFSQGGAVAYLTLLRSDFQLAGCVCLSTWTPTILHAKKKITLAHPKALKTPIFHGHGTDDPLILLKYGLDSVEYMQKLGFNVQMKQYNDLGHGSNVEELSDVAEFMVKALSKTHEENK